MAMSSTVVSYMVMFGYIIYNICVCVKVMYAYFTNYLMHGYLVYCYVMYVYAVRCYVKYVYATYF